MKLICDVSRLSDEQLLQNLESLRSERASLSARELIHIAEVDQRKLFLSRACSSMFAYCTEVLGLSEGAAYKRITAARAGRETPYLIERISQGKLHLAGAALVAHHLKKLGSQAGDRAPPGCEVPKGRGEGESP